MPRRKERERAPPRADLPVEEPEAHLLKLVSDVACAYMRHNQLRVSELGAFLADVHASLLELSGAPQIEATPAVPIKRSIDDDFIVCLENGKKLKTLKRYLMSKFGLTPDAYRRKWRLPIDYPMVAPSYARLRSEFAKKSGLGRSPGRRKKKPT